MEQAGAEAAVGGEGARGTGDELARLREALLTAYPETVAELVAGESVGELLASLERAGVRLPGGGGGCGGSGGGGRWDHGRDGNGAGGAGRGRAAVGPRPGAAADGREDPARAGGAGVTSLPSRES
jgi:hypothetical protein